MTELIYQINEHKVEGPELFPKRAVLEGIRTELLDDFITDCFDKKRELDELIELAIEVRETREAHAA
jgi:hypothetical protein